MGRRPGFVGESGVSFLIRCMGHKSIKLMPGETVKIGRHSSNDLVLKDGTVSRFHASIVWDLFRGNVDVVADAVGFTITPTGTDTYGDPALSGGGQAIVQITHSAALLLFMTALRPTDVCSPWVDSSATFHSPGRSFPHSCRSSPDSR